MTKKRGNFVIVKCRSCGQKFTAQRSTRRYCSNACRQHPHNQRKRNKPIVSNFIGDSSEAMRRIASLHFQDGWRIADVTYGKGVFWKKLQGRYDLVASDLTTVPDAPHDFRSLPYADNEFDAVVIDPPFGHNSGSFYLDHAYANGSSAPGIRASDLIDLYKAGMTECCRVLRGGGILVVKCQDDNEGGRQVRISTEVWQHAVSRLMLVDVDLLIMAQPRRPIVNSWTQRTSRKNHSMFWVFRKRMAHR